MKRSLFFVLCFWKYEIFRLWSLLPLFVYLPTCCWYYILHFYQDVHCTCWNFIFPICNGGGVFCQIRIWISRRTGRCQRFAFWINIALVPAYGRFVINNVNLFLKCLISKTMPWILTYKLFSVISDLDFAILLARRLF